MSSSPLLPLTVRLLAELPALKADPQMALLRELQVLPPDEAAEVALQVLENMDEATGVLAGMVCAEEVRQHGKAGQLARLQAARQRVPTFSGLRDWRGDVDGAIAALEALAKKRCRCASVRANNTAPVPPMFVELSSNSANYVEVMQVRCALCGREYTVERDDSYHYPIFTWR